MKELIFENLKHSDNKEFETASNLGAVFLFSKSDFDVFFELYI